MAKFAAGPQAVEATARSLARKGSARLDNFLASDVANRLRASLADDAPWWRTFNQGEKAWDLGPESLAVLDDSQSRTIDGSIHSGAERGFQYVYETIRVAETRQQRAARNLVVDRLIDQFNSSEGLALFRSLTGNDKVALIDGQATRYLRGHFLTRHDDAVEGKNRIAAYVLNLNPEWRPEWGGLLLFHKADGEVTHGFVPRFNTLNIFRVPQPHSVSIVTPFAPTPRLAVTGWIRTKG